MGRMRRYSSSDFFRPHHQQVASTPKKIKKQNQQFGRQLGPDPALWRAAKRNFIVKSTEKSTVKSVEKPTQKSTAKSTEQSMVKSMDKSMVKSMEQIHGGIHGGMVGGSRAQTKAPARHRPCACHRSSTRQPASAFSRACAQTMRPENMGASWI